MEEAMSGWGREQLEYLGAATCERSTSILSNNCWLSSLPDDLFFYFRTNHLLKKLQETALKSIFSHSLTTLENVFENQRNKRKNDEISWKNKKKVDGEFFKFANNRNFKINAKIKHSFEAIFNTNQMSLDRIKSFRIESCYDDFCQLVKISKICISFIKQISNNRKRRRIPETRKVLKARNSRR